MKDSSEDDDQVAGLSSSLDDMGKSTNICELKAICDKSELSTCSCDVCLKPHIAHPKSFFYSRLSLAF